MEEIVLKRTPDRPPSTLAFYWPRAATTGHIVTWHLTRSAFLFVYIFTCPIPPINTHTHRVCYWQSLGTHFLMEKKTRKNKSRRVWLKVQTFFVVKDDDWTVGGSRMLWSGRPRPDRVVRSDGKLGRQCEIRSAFGSSRSEMRRTVRFNKTRKKRHKTTTTTVSLPNWTEIKFHRQNCCLF